MKLSVLIPTYNRPNDLDRCLDGLSKQLRLPDQVVVVTRTGDDASAAIISKWQSRLSMKNCVIAVPGMIQALNLGLDNVDGDVVCMTDDDTFPKEDWLSLIERHFVEDPRLGGLGGRDLVYIDGKIIPASAQVVGRIMWYGRIVGNHHVGIGQAREVDHIKGANMSWRMSAIGGHRFATEMRGTGAQVFNELAFSCEIKRRGWRIVYDPSIQVHHYPAPRFDNDRRDSPDVTAWQNASFNLYVAVQRYMQPGAKKTMALLWMKYVGTPKHPGLLRGVGFRLKRDTYGIKLRSVTARAWEDAQSFCSQ